MPSSFSSPRAPFAPLNIREPTSPSSSPLPPRSDGVSRRRVSLNSIKRFHLHFDAVSPATYVRTWQMEGSALRLFRLEWNFHRSLATLPFDGCFFAREKELNVTVSFVLWLGMPEEIFARNLKRVKSVHGE